MSNFSYVALDPSGKEQQGFVEADSQSLAITLIKEKGLSVRETEQIILKFKEGPKKKAVPSVSLDPDLLRIQDELSTRLGAMVRILEGKKGGKIQIPFASAEDLDRIYSLLLE